MRVVNAFGLVINENSLKVISLTLKLFKELFDNGISSSSGIVNSRTCTSKRKSDGKEDNIQENKKKEFR